VLRSYQTDGEADRWPELSVGRNRLTCIVPAGLLNGGVYHLCPRIGLHNLYWIVNMDSVVRFETVLSHGVSPMWNSLTGKSRSGAVAPILEWQSRASTLA